MHNAPNGAQQAALIGADKGIDTHNEPKIKGGGFPSMKQVREAWNKARYLRGRPADDASFSRWWKGEEAHP